MFIQRSKSTRIFVLLIFALVLAAATYGFAEANVVNSGNVMNLGEGTGTISGYAVTVAYDVDLANPSQVDAIDLTLDNDATTVQISLDSGATWINCTGATTSWTCTTTVNVTAATSLMVFASDQTVTIVP